MESHHVWILPTGQPKPIRENQGADPRGSVAERESPATGLSAFGEARRSGNDLQPEQGRLVNLCTARKASVALSIPRPIAAWSRGSNRTLRGMRRRGWRRFRTSAERWSLNRSPSGIWTASELEPGLDADGVQRAAAGAGWVAAGFLSDPLAGGAGGVPGDIWPRYGSYALSGTEGDHGSNATQSTTEVSRIEDEVMVNDVPEVRVPVSRKPLVPPGV